MHDLEIRGAGEVLGESQSGEMQEVGFALYAEMLNAAVRALRSGREPELTGQLNVGTDINLHTPALLPESYCANVHQRLIIYKGLSNCQTEDELQTMQEEIIDRFGPMPDTVRHLIETHRLRIVSQPLGVARIDAGPDAIVLQFVSRPPIDPGRIIQLVQSRRGARFAGPDRIRIDTSIPEVAARAGKVRELLQSLT
jgi:transcription-repair coupling factor (superfamily II helicase)